MAEMRRLQSVVGPDGQPLTMGDLPPSHQQRWVPRQKANIVAAVRGGLITIDEACRRYKLTMEEFLSWQRAFELGGIAGLRVTRIKRRTDTAKTSER